MSFLPTIYLLADGHLGAQAGDIDHFVHWLEGLDPMRTELILLGDFCHIWAGPKKYHTEGVTRLLEALTRFDQAGGRVDLVVGNRDIFFDFGQDYPHQGLPFQEISGDFLTRTIQGKRLLCAHGDLVNRQDEQYLRWRGWVRSKAFRWFFSLLPSFWVKGVMTRLEEKLQQTNQGHRLSFPLEEWQAFLEQARREPGFDLLCIGHFHPESLLETPVGSGMGLVLPDWQSSGQVLKIDEDLNYELVKRL